jgi:purine-nucleoside/S-methyl-5'-thioadenosine phosphorylase / adenosine deaminase
MTMLERRSAANGVVYYASPLLEGAGIPHAFSTRIGGLSPAPFDSLNLGNPSGCDIVDDYERIWENYRLLASACGCGALELLRVHQVHGATVLRATRGEHFDNASKADAIVSDDPRRIASVRVADCVPVLLAMPDGKTVAAVHAGWRGVVAGVVTAALSELLASDVHADGVLAAIGPCIGFEAFEVGPEVLAEFRRQFGGDAPLRIADGGKGFVDLRAAVRLQLLGAGVSDEQIDMTDCCTHRDQAEFFSHRRENGVTGRMAAIIRALD